MIVASWSCLVLASTGRLDTDGIIANRRNGNKRLGARALKQLQGTIEKSITLWCWLGMHDPDEMEASVFVDIHLISIGCRGSSLALP